MDLLPFLNDIDSTAYFEYCKVCSRLGVGRDGMGWDGRWKGNEWEEMGRDAIRCDDTDL